MGRKTVQKSQKKKKYQRKGSALVKSIKIFSSICAIVGGSILAANIEISSFGFLILATSSSSMTVAGILEKDFLLVFYSGGIFFFVDLLGIFRWIIWA